MILRFKTIFKFKQLPLLIAFASLLFPIISVSAANNSINSVTSNFFQNNLMFYDPNECFEGTTSSSDSGAYISGSAIEEKIWSGLINMNYKPEIVAGIMGNMSGESGFNPARYENSHNDVWEKGFEWETDTSEGYGVGLIQWSGERRVKFFQYMRKEANNLTDKYLKKPNTYGGLSGDDFLSKAESESDVDSLISIELQYLNQELSNTSSYKDMLKQSSVEDATKYFAENVEGCSKCKDENSETMKKRLEEADRIFKTYNGKNSEGGNAVATTGDYSNIQAAKNADKSVSGVDTSSEWYAGWSDTDTEGLKRVLEHYGDLAYQTGRALNVPWQAILVQMRYENARAMCGSSASPNNFWGMGCTGGSIAESRNNLGEGFVTYAKYVTNEYQKHAIGIQDPYEYLVELGPSWVQGCLRTATGWDNGEGSDAGCTGYSEIDNMKKSLGVLESYIQTPEGQAIVQSFGDYKVTSSSSEDCCNPDSLPSTAGTYKGATWQLSDEDLKTLSRIALNENGRTLVSFQSELSLMANLTDRHSGYSDVLDYVIRGGWFSTARDHCSSNRKCDYTDEVDSEHLAAAKDIIVNGNRTLPDVVVEHDCFYPECGAGIGSISNDGGKTWISVGSHAEASKMKDQFKRGETILKQDGGGLSSQYYFWDFADPSDTQTDPFGYLMDESPSESELQPTKGSSSTTIAGSNVTWTDDGWISSGIEKYYKDSLEDLPQQETWGADYLTDSLSTKHSGKGPNKILLHATEGGSSGGDSVHYIYAGQLDANDGKTVPPHFTIDIKNKIIYQHQSIWKGSAAIKSDSAGNGDLTAGIQIEIVGYDYGNGTGGEWDLTDGEKFGDNEWQYLAEFLNAISVETGIPLESTVDWSDNDSVRMTDLEEFKNYQGILSHKHAPLNDHSDVSEAVWNFIEPALAAYAGAQQQNNCPGATGNFQQTLLAFAWEEYQNEGSDKRTTPKDAYYAAIHKPGAYLADDDDGKDCGVFVTAIVRESGLDPDYNSAGGNTTGQLEYVKNPENGWQDVTDSIKSNNDARPGDVLLTKEGYTGHTLIYVGNVPGFSSVMASASWHERVPMADSQNDIMFYINGDGLGRKYYVFRKVN